MAKFTEQSAIKLPLKVAFTETGVNYFIRKKAQITHLKLVDNASERGIELSTFTPALVQQMIMLGYVSKIETSALEFSAVRHEFMELSNLIVYSKLYKQFSSVALTALLSCDCVRMYNRTHPDRIFSEIPSVDISALQSVLKTYEDKRLIIAKRITKPILTEIMLNNKYDNDEKAANSLLVERFLTKMDLYNWYIILFFSGDAHFEEIVNTMYRLINEYYQKSTVAEYIAPMLLEVSGNYETLNIRNEAKIIYRGVTFNNTMLLNPAVRQRILAEIKRKENYVSISWKFARTSSSTEKENLLNISVYNTTTGYSNIKQSIETTKSANLKKQTLVDFYRDLPKEQAGSDLGLYYLSYLEEACKKVNVKFSSHINELISNDLTVIELNFKF
ncbi:MAG: hypothetical protein R3Y36_02985 [Spirochaetales bacterium]